MSTGREPEEETAAPDVSLPYGHQWIDEDDVRMVKEALQSDWLTTGPRVEEFEATLARFVGARSAVAVSSGTAALHAAMYAAGVGAGDEVIVPAMTFVATASAVVFLGGKPVFADVDEDTLLIDPNQVEDHVTSRTKAIVAVDYAGQPAEYDRLRPIAKRHGLVLVADACHALGAEDKGQKVGTLADLTVFSFHPVKHITTGEGGMIVTETSEWEARMRQFRNHGILQDRRQREEKGTWFYEVGDLGFNYRLTDFQCALGVSQVRRLPEWVARRRGIAAQYDAAFAEMPGVSPLTVRDDVRHSYHLYVIQLDPDRLEVSRAKVFARLRADGIGVNVHYVPVHLHPFYRDRFGTQPGSHPAAEAAYERILSLPIYPRMADADVGRVIHAVREACSTPAS